MTALLDGVGFRDFSTGGIPEVFWDLIAEYELQQVGLADQTLGFNGDRWIVIKIDRKDQSSGEVHKVPFLIQLQRVDAGWEIVDPPRDLTWLIIGTLQPRKGGKIFLIQRPAQLARLASLVVNLGELFNQETSCEY